jgi:hypothetical protein
MMTIEGKDGKFLIFLKFETPEGKKLSIKIPVDSYKED